MLELPYELTIRILTKLNINQNKFSKSKSFYLFLSSIIQSYTLFFKGYIIKNKGFWYYMFKIVKDIEIIKDYFPTSSFSVIHDWDSYFKRYSPISSEDKHSYVPGKDHFMYYILSEDNINAFLVLLDRVGLIGNEKENYRIDRKTNVYFARMATCLNASKILKYMIEKLDFEQPGRCFDLIEEALIYHSDKSFEILLERISLKDLKNKTEETKSKSQIVLLLRYLNKYSFTDLKYLENDSRILNKTLEIKTIFDQIFTKNNFKLIYKLIMTNQWKTLETIGSSKHPEVPLKIKLTYLIFECSMFDQEFYEDCYKYSKEVIINKLKKIIYEKILKYDLNNDEKLEIKGFEEDFSERYF